MIILKSCTKCDNSIDFLHPIRKYCDECRKQATNESHKEGRLKRKNIEDFGAFLKENFFKAVSEPFHLTTSGFNEVSNFSCKTYTQYFKKQWIEIVKVFGKFEELYNYVLDEYKCYINNGNRNLNTLCKNHKYLTYKLLQAIGLDDIRKDSGIKKMRYTGEDFSKNFNRVMAELGHVPLFNEFVSMSEISLNTYAEKFNLKGKVYDNVVKHFVNDAEYKEYLKNKKEHKTAVGTETGKLSQTYSDEDYETEFHRVFEHCKKEFGIYPPRRLFNKLSKFDDRNYRKKYKKSWTMVCGQYGYKIERSHRMEKMVINLISNLTNCKFDEQVCFTWLKGVGGQYLRCDGYSMKLKLVVEFDGIQHRIPVKAFGGEEKYETLKANDHIKNEEIPKRGLKLLRIDSREKWYDKEFLKQRLIEIGIPVLD